LRSAYYGSAKYGCSFYGLIMPISHTMAINTIGAAALAFNDVGDVEFSDYSEMGNIAFSYDSY